MTGYRYESEWVIVAPHALFCDFEEAKQKVKKYANWKIENQKQREMRTEKMD